MNNPPSGTVTFLFTDIEGSTKLAQQYPDAMPAVYGISGIMAWLIFTLLLATFASAFPARRASRLTVRDTLAYE